MSSEEINDVLDMVSLISIPNVLENDLMLSVDENDALKAIYADVCSMFKQHNYNNVLFTSQIIHTSIITINFSFDHWMYHD